MVEADNIKCFLVISLCFILSRKIEIDLEELECEGIEPILIDWQGGFLGSVANDLMWALFPFFEKDNKLYSKVKQTMVLNKI